MTVVSMDEVEDEDFGDGKYPKLVRVSVAAYFIFRTLKYDS